MLKLPDGTVKVLVEGVARVTLKDIKETTKFISSEYNNFPEKITKPMKVKL